MTTAHDEGMLAAWRHLRLAGLAVGAPLGRLVRERIAWGRARVPYVTAMQIYLIANLLLYAVVAVVYLATLPHPGTHVRDALLSSLPAHILWGITAALVSFAQLITLFVRAPRAWALCAAFTAAWASAFGMALIFDAARYSANFGGLALWGWVLTIHFIFIRNQLTPLAYENPHAPSVHLESRDEHDFAARLESMLTEHPRESQAESEEVAPAP